MNRISLTAILLLLTAFASTPLHCTIGRSGITYEYPLPGEVLPINGRILIFAEGCAVEHAARMKEYQPVLQGANECVELSVREAMDSAPGSKRLELFLVPVRELKPNSQYRLRMLNPPAMDDCLKDAVTIWNTLADIDEYDSEPLFWTTSNEADHTPPQWNSPPIVMRASWPDNDGAMPPPTKAVSVTISMPTNSDGQIAIAEVSRGSVFSAKILDTSYEGSIGFSCGCDYCDIRECFPSEKYRVWITAMDLAGNEARAPRAIEFRIPDPPPSPYYAMDIKLYPNRAPLSGMEIASSEVGIKARIEGTVELLVSILPEGSVKDVQVLKGLPLKISDLAVESVKKWVFASQDSVESRTVTVTIKYNIIFPPYEPNWAP